MWIEKEKQVGTKQIPLGILQMEYMQAIPITGGHTRLLEFGLNDFLIFFLSENEQLFVTLFTSQFVTGMTKTITFKLVLS